MGVGVSGINNYVHVYVSIQSEATFNWKQGPYQSPVNEIQI